MLISTDTVDVSIGRARLLGLVGQTVLAAEVLVFKTAFDTDISHWVDSTEYAVEVHPSFPS